VYDDHEARQQATDYFAVHGVDASVSDGPESARTILSMHRFDIVVVRMPLDDGEALGLVRELVANRFPPVVISTTSTDTNERAVVLELGADDCLSEPYAARELLARLRGVHRRVSGARQLPQPRMATFDDWRLDVAAHLLIRSDGSQTRLTSGELGILRALVEHPGQVIRRQDFLAFTRRDDSEVFERTIDVMVTRIRRKIELDPRRPQFIKTVRGQGYQFARPVNWSVAELS
jgi:two-component system OmpR family response regulator